LRLASSTLAAAALALPIVFAGCSKRHVGPGGGPTPTSTSIGSVGRAGSSNTLATVSSASESERTVTAPVERVWQVLPAVYEELGIPVTTLVDAERLVGNDAMKVRRRLGSTPMQRYLDCGGTGGAPNAETYEITMSVMTKLHDLGQGLTAVVTRLEASAVSPFGGNSVACGSTGNLERRMLMLLADRLKG
jgi:hypothetical protein